MRIAAAATFALLAVAIAGSAVAMGQTSLFDPAIDKPAPAGVGMAVGTYRCTSGGLPAPKRTYKVLGRDKYALSRGGGGGYLMYPSGLALFDGPIRQDIDFSSIASYRLRRGVPTLLVLGAGAKEVATCALDH